MILTCDNQNQSARRLVAIRPVSAFSRDCRIQAAGVSSNATMKKSLIDISGVRFGRIIPIKRNGADRFGNAKWMCICDCGKKFIAISNNIRSGNTSSCGCLKSEIDSTRTRTHGMSKTGSYSVWTSMKQRCLNPKNKDFKYYGGRGITICKKWLKYENFVSDMGLRPSQDHQIDRKNNNLGYSKQNCRWTDRIHQMSNTRSNKYIEFDGCKMTFASWSRATGLSPKTIRYRLKAGWSIKKTLTTHT